MPRKPGASDESGSTSDIKDSYEDRGLDEDEPRSEQPGP